MSALPKPVQEQIDQANKIADAIYPKDADGNPISPEKAAELAAAGEEVTPPADPPADAENTPPSPAADAENTPAPEPAPEPAPTAEKDPDHKYKVLQGKYNAEVPRLQAQLRESTELVTELRQRVNNTESLLAAMSAAPSNTPAEPPPPATPPGISEEERAQFGPDLIDVIERVAAAKVMPEIEQRVAPLKTTVEQASQRASQAEHSMAVSEREKTLNALEAAVPDWQQQNEDQGFLNWLNEKDAYAGVPRGKLLTDAFRANDANRVIAFFKGFQTENAVVTPSTPAPPVVEPQVNLADQVAPGTPKTGTTSAPNESGKRQWSRNDISAFYAKKNEFVTKGVPIPDEFQQLERDLIAAQREGRIR